MLSLYREQSKRMIDILKKKNCFLSSSLLCVFSIHVFLSIYLKPSLNLNFIIFNFPSQTVNLLNAQASIFIDDGVVIEIQILKYKNEWGNK